MGGSKDMETVVRIFTAAGFATFLSFFFGAHLNRDFLFCLEEG